MLRAVIIDDEEPGISTLKVLAARHAASIRIVASTVDAAEGITLIEDYKPDIVFLDISMPSMSGFELLSKLTHRDFRLVFTTAHQEYAIQAIKSRAFDYLLKPVSGDDFRECISKIMDDVNDKPREVKQGTNGMVELFVKDGIIFIRQNDIIRLEASRSYTEFHLDNGVKHVASKTLKEFQSQLDETLFYRCHQSHIINLQKVKKFVNRDGFFAQMSDGSMVDISKKSKDVLLERLKAI